ncbi:hypothetical protein GCM10010145_51840 [Streptomyces ruber]|uniref:Delta(24)-sterol reductase n=2 Tax=Streptomyces TaxID=1883 RepID=A0A918BLC9_9ACTN|nr:FAD-binding protein [Streptomyces ruber]GGQ75787.1 hypothetical protein GCM10010145_51840 [Streptomyces ruber]
MKTPVTDTPDRSVAHDGAAALPPAPPSPAALPAPYAPPAPPAPSAGTRPSGAPRSRHRTLTVPLFLAVTGLLSLVCASYAACRRALRRLTPHEKRVARLGATVRRRAGERAGLLCTGSGAGVRAALRTSSPTCAARPVRLGLDAVLRLDTERRVVRVEPGVTMGRLVRHLARRGWTLPVAPGPDSATVGGLTMGCGVDAASHRYGLFADTVESYDVLLGTGEVVRVSATEHPDLFHALPWSRGSLGFVVAVELRVVPARPWVEVRYHPVAGPEEMCRDLTRLAEAADGPAFVEGFVHGPGEGVVVTAEFADRPRGRRNHVRRWYKPSFRAHARARARTGAVEYVPLGHYHRRHGRGLLGHPRHAVAQEALVPAHHLEDLVRHCRQVFEEADGLWVRPARLTRGATPGLVGPGPEVGAGQRQLFMDVAVLAGAPGRARRGALRDAEDAARRFAAWVNARQGFQAVPHAPSGPARDEHRSMFDCWLYDRVRHAYGAEGVFVDAYDRAASR